MEKRDAEANHNRLTAVIAAALIVAICIVGSGIAYALYSGSVQRLGSPAPPTGQPTKTTCLSNAEYRTEYDALVNRYASAYRRVVQLMTQHRDATDNPMFLADLADSLNELDDIARDIQALRPPKDYLIVDGPFKQFAAELLLVTDATRQQTFSRARVSTGQHGKWMDYYFNQATANLASFAPTDESCP